MTLSTKNVTKSYVLASLVHDTFFPDKKGLKYKFKDGDVHNIRTDNFEFFEQKRWDGKTKNSHLTKMIIAKHAKGKRKPKELGVIFGMTPQAIWYHLNKTKTK